MRDMSSRPRRSTANQKDNNDMLGLSRQEERMLQRAMYDSLRQQSKFKLNRFRKSALHKKSMTTRSMATRRLTVSLPDNIVKDVPEPSGQEDSARSTEDPKVEQEIKRGTRYSPMRKGPLSEMLKSLENKKTLFDSSLNSVALRPSERKSASSPKKRDEVSREVEQHFATKCHRKVTDSSDPRKSARGTTIKNEINRSIVGMCGLRSSANFSSKLPMTPRRRSYQRSARSASLTARSHWQSQPSNTPANTCDPKPSPGPVSTELDERNQSQKTESSSQKHLVYNKKRMSSSQRMSRTIVATATKRFKKAKLKSDIVENTRRINSKMKAAKDAEIHNSMVIPPELWLDPKGQPVDTQDFINFLLYRDTPYLEPSLKWFHLPPHRRKQRLFKVIQSEPGMKFNETVVYTEKKEGGGKEVMVHCNPPKLFDDNSEPMSSTSDQSSAPMEKKCKLAGSVNSSCNTHAAVDEEVAINAAIDKVDIEENVKRRLGPGRPKATSLKVLPTYEYRSKHLMETRNRKS